MKDEELVEVMARAIAFADDPETEWTIWSEYAQEEFRSAARAALTALRSAGYAVVPREATEGMALAYLHTTPSTDWRDNIQRAWTAMIAEAEK